MGRIGQDWDGAILVKIGKDPANPGQSRSHGAPGIKFRSGSGTSHYAVYMAASAFAKALSEDVDLGGAGRVVCVVVRLLARLESPF